MSRSSTFGLYSSVDRDHYEYHFLIHQDDGYVDGVYYNALDSKRDSVTELGVVDGPTKYMALLNDLPCAEKWVRTEKSGEDVTVEGIRAAPEKRLGLLEGFYNNHAIWKDLSRFIIEHQVNNDGNVPDSPVLAEYKPNPKPERAKQIKRKRNREKYLQRCQAETERLQAWLAKYGIRKVWAGDTPKAKTKHLRDMLSNAGMTGRYSIEKANRIRESREMTAFIEAIREGE
ncbi:hypothetical protein DV736_g2087, partial [Chaetothyriales sp. CBS 134916]